MQVPTVNIDFLDPNVISDPFPFYEEIRAAGRVVWNSTLRVWMIPGFDDCAAVTTGSGERFRISVRRPRVDPLFMRET